MLCLLSLNNLFCFSPQDLTCASSWNLIFPLQSAAWGVSHQHPAPMGRARPSVLPDPPPALQPDRLQTAPLPLSPPCGEGNSLPGWDWGFSCPRDDAPACPHGWLQARTAVTPSQGRAGGGFAEAAAPREKLLRQGTS